MTAAPHGTVATKVVVTVPASVTQAVLTPVDIGCGLAEQVLAYIYMTVWRTDTSPQDVVARIASGVFVSEKGAS